MVSLDCAGSLSFGEKIDNNYYHKELKQVADILSCVIKEVIYEDYYANFMTWKGVLV